MKKIKERLRTGHANAEKKREAARPHSRRDAQEAEAANVRYFLHALNQMSLALQALGYATEGAALVKVRVDLNNRLFHSSGKTTDIAQLLN